MWRSLARVSVRRAEARQLEIWLDPIGFLKGAMTTNDLVTFDRYEGGGEHRQFLAYTVGKFRIQGSLEPGTNRVVRIQTFVPHPLLGDMVEEKTYADYKQFGNVWFPTRFHHHTNWDHELRPQGFFGVPEIIPYLLLHGHRPVAADARSRQAVVVHKRTIRTTRTIRTIN